MGLLKAGILGGGQLARFLALSLLKRGINVSTLYGESCRFLKNVVALEELLDSSDVLFAESELQSALLDKIPGEKLATPLDSFHIASDRRIAKSFLKENSFPIVPEGTEVFKSVNSGYDGRGVFFGYKPETIDCIGETFVTHDREIALMVAREKSGKSLLLPATETIQKNGVCRLCHAPIEISSRFKEVAIGIAEKLNIIGIIAIEFFDVGGEPLVNEFAIRPHNSYHWSLSMAHSQFDYYVDAVMGQELTEPKVIENVTMKNYIGGDELVGGISNCQYYVYDKIAKEGRKLGHVNFVGEDFSRNKELLDKVIVEKN